MIPPSASPQESICFVSLPNTTYRSRLFLPLAICSRQA
jgi:hypothetical protein